MKYLLRKLPVIIALCSAFTGSSQVFWTETFGTGCNQGQSAGGWTGVNGAWSLVDFGVPGSDPNTWFVSATEGGMGEGNCGDGCLASAVSNQTLHIANVSTSPLAGFFCPTGDCGAAYDAGLGGGQVVVDRAAVSPVINCTGYSNIELSFLYMEGGNGATDNGEVLYYDGVSWFVLGDPASTATCAGGQGVWTRYTVTLPASADNNANVQIGFRWYNNDDGAGADPSFAIDDVTLNNIGCNPDVGTFTMDVDGVPTSLGSTVYLCNDGSCLNVTSNGDYTLPPAVDMGACTTVPEIMWAFYTAAPTTGDPSTDPAWDGTYWTGSDFNECLSGAGSSLGNPQNSEWWMAPITADDGDNDGGCGGLNHDQDGDGCFVQGTPIHIVYLTEITNAAPDVNCYNGVVTFQVFGGLPAWDGSTYTVTSTASGNVVSSNTTDGDYVVVNGLTDGDTYSITVTDGVGCELIVSGTYTECPCPSAPSFTNLPVNMACDDAAVTIWPDQTAMSPGETVTPCYYVEILPTNSNTNNSLDYYENGSLIGSLTPTANTNYSGYISYVSPSQTNTVDLCDVSAGTDMTYMVFDCHSGNLITSGTWIADGTGCQTITVTPPASNLSGTGTWSGNGIVGTSDWGGALFDPGTAGPGTHTITYTWDDGNGCVTVMTQDVTVTDPTPPTITCPGTQTQVLDANCETLLADYTGMAVTNDNCGPVTVTQSPAIGTLYSGEQTVAVTLTADDGVNTTSCSFNVNIVDNSPPTITCPADQTVSFDANCEYTLLDYTGLATAADNCSVTVTQSPLPGTTITSTQTITLTADDGNGNTTTCTFNVIPEDNTNPTIACPADQTVTFDANCEYTLTDYTGMATTSDNCGPITVTQSPAVGTVITGTTAVTLTATDGNSNSANCTFNVIPEDNTPPSVTCPGNQTETVDASCDFSIPDYTGMASATDNCDASPTLSQSPAVGTIISGSGTTQTITITATDADGNSSNCTFTVTLEDVTPPSITCPANTTETVDASCNFSIPDYTGSATVTDNCDPAPTVTQSPVVGTIISGHGTVQTITLTATDADGNSASCTFDITLDDATPPSITCPATQTVSANANCEWTMADYTGMATVSDNCTASASIVITQSPAIGSTQSGSQTVTLTADDGNGNTNTCTFTVNVDDTTPPSITCPANTTEFVDANCEFILPDYTGSATVTDNCDPAPSVTQSPAAGTVISGSGTVQTITITATDADGNSNSCTFDVTLDDNIDPVVTCPGNTTEPVDANCEFTIPDYTAGAATDNCDANPTVTQSPVAGTVISGDGTVQTVTLTATDADGNSASCSFDITLDDTTLPTITCPGDQNVSANASCEFTMADYTSMATVADNCTAAGSIVITQSPAAGSLVSGTQTVTLTADDGNGNTETCTFQVIVTDNTPPTITCSGGNVSEPVDANCEFIIPDYTTTVTVSDNCTPAASLTMTQSPTSGTVISGSGTVQTVWVYAEDANGNIDSCSFDVTLIDNLAPTVTCPANTTEPVDANCEFTIPDYTAGAATDNCDANPTVTQSPVAGTVISGDGTVQTVTITATDADGNSASCSFDITLDDTTLPTITCPGDQNVSANASCEFTMADYTSMATVTDNCTAAGSIVITQSPAAGTVVSGTQTVTLTADDGNGNTETCTFQVIVADNTPPTITCSGGNVSENVDANCEFIIPDYTTTATVSDNCTPTASLTMTQSPTAGTVISGSGTVQTVWLYASDANGNIDSCSFDVTLIDNLAPTVTCPGNATEPVDANCEFIVPDYTSGAATDNCDPNPTVTQSPVAGTVLSGAGTVQTVTITATDADGNSASCSFDITLDDTTLPTISCPGDQNVSANASCEFTMADYTSMATVTDNCTAAASIVVTQSPAAGTLVSGTQTVTLTADDGNGNTETCTFQVIVADNTPPTISCSGGNVSEPVDANCEFIIPDYTTTATVSDNCTPAASLTMTQSPTAGTVISGSGTVQTVWIYAEDANGNIDSCSFDVTLIDNLAPTVTCPANTTEPVDANCEFTIPDYTAGAATDNCDANPTVTQSPVAGTVISGDGTVQTVTITATDADGNSASCSFDITLDDTTLPTITCPGDQNVSANASCEFTMADYTSMATVTDNCTAAASIVVTQSPAAGTLVSGTQTVTLTADDGNGNTETCTFQVIVADNTAPTITCSGGNVTEYVDANCDFTIPDYTVTASATDNCTPAGSLTLTQSPANGSVISGAGTVQTVWVYAEDANGNIDSCSFDVTLQDTIQPVMNCPTNTNEYVDGACEFIIPDYTSGAATDNCDANPTITQTPAAGTVISGAGTVQTITIDASDASGNSNSCTFDITLVDTIAPTSITCPPDQTESPDANCQFVLPDYTSLASATDNCTAAASIIFTQSPTAGTTITGTTTVTITADDGNGNTIDCTFDVILSDTIVPVIANCPPDQTEYADATCGFTIPDYTTGLTVTDNCGTPTTSQVPASGTVVGVGVTSVTIYATDANGNVDSCLFNVTVIDSIPPAIVCPGNITMCDTDPNPTWVDPAGSDNCSPVTVTQTGGPSSGSSVGIGTSTVTYEVADTSGNTAQCSFTITVDQCIVLEVEIPTGFTPDGDGINDEWEIPNLNILYPDCHVQVYNRWGSLLFESTGYDEAWDGTYNGNLMPVGSYFFVIDFNDGEREPVTGSVSIIMQ